MKCTSCQYDNVDESRYCNKCATPLSSSEEIYLSPTKTFPLNVNKFYRGSIVAGRYEVIEELGNSGMGRVLRVFDQKIEEEATLKILTPEIAYDKKTIERFRNELKFSRKITHKNICRIYDLDEDGGTYFISMEYVSGEDLKSMIRMTKHLGIGTAVRISKQVCEGLAEAHKLGIFHRDLKSSNVIIDREGNARVMDFGIARSPDTEDIINDGSIIGTPEYMSPEQAEEKQVDHRSDIYSFGVMLYEMVTGQLPFNGDTPFNMLVKRKSSVPRDPRELNSEIPEELSRMILKCMKEDREKRYQSVKEILSELKIIEDGITTIERAIPVKKTTMLSRPWTALKKRWVMFALLFVVVVTAGLTLAYFKGGILALPPSPSMLVILPFDNLGPPEDEYFTDGITEEITSRLSALQGLNVISRTSANRYKNTNKTSKQIGEELDADFVLEGSVRWDRNSDGKGKARITPTLIRVEDDTHLWSDTYDRIIEDIFAAQSEIAEEVARQLDLTILEPERKVLHAKPTENLEAYDFYLKGREREDRGWARADNEEFKQALKLFEKAIQLDPNFALAYVQMSLIHSRMYFFGADCTNDCLAKSRAAAERALQLQPDLPDAKVALALYYYRGLLDYERATEIFKSILRTRPNFSVNLLGYIQRRQGKWEQSLKNLEKSFKFNPRYSQLAYEIGLSYLAMRKYEQGEEWFNRVLSINPEHFSAQMGKVSARVLSEGNTNDAKALLETLPQHRLKDYMRYTLGMLDRDYQKVLDLLVSLSYTSFEGQHFYFHKNLIYASVYYAMKEPSLMKTHADLARIALEKAIEENPDDPRFHASLGLAYAYLGHNAEAVREGNRAVNLYPVSKDAALGPIYVHNLARIYTVVGVYDRAIEQLEYLLSIPSCEYLWHLVSVPMLQFDPQWDVLRGDPGFLRLMK